MQAPEMKYNVPKMFYLMGMAKSTKTSRENNTVFYLYVRVFHEYNLLWFFREC